MEKPLNVPVNYYCAETKLKWDWMVLEGCNTVVPSITVKVEGGRPDEMHKLYSQFQDLLINFTTRNPPHRDIDFSYSQVTPTEVKE